MEHQEVPRRVAQEEARGLRGVGPACGCRSVGPWPQMRIGVGLMADADCAICASLGYRTCDRCSGVIFHAREHPLGVELCEDCRG